MDERIAALPVEEVIDVRVYALSNTIGHAYIGTESGHGSHELIFRSSPELANRARPWIESGELYGLMLPISAIVSAD